MAEERVIVQSAERSLRGRMFAAEAPTGRAVLIGHGYGAKSQVLKNYARPLAKDGGVTCLTFDLGGHGVSQGNKDELTISDHLADMLAAYDHLAVHPDVDPQRIGIIGMSYSGYLASLATASRTVKGLLLRAPPLCPDYLRNTPHGEYDGESVLQAEPDKDNAAFQALRSYGGNVVLVTMGQDEVVMPATTDAYGAALQHGERKTIPDAVHSLNYETQPLFQDIALEWAQRL